MTQPLADTLAMVAQAARGAKDDWWIIGSAAVILHGAKVADLRDVDLMMSPRDADLLLRRVRGQRQPVAASDRFRSEVFGNWHEPPLPVEIFGGFRVATDEGWREVSFASRQVVTIAGASVYVPSREELVGLLQSFGRPKDKQRMALLPI